MKSITETSHTLTMIDENGNQISVERFDFETHIETDDRVILTNAGIEALIQVLK